MKGKVSVILIIATAVVVAFLMSLLIRGRLIEFRDVAIETLAERGDLLKDRQKLAELESLKSQESSLRDYVNACRSLIPDKPDESGLIGYLQEMAGNPSDLLQVKFDERKKADNYVIMPFTITFEGSYQELVNFIRNIKNGGRAVRIDGFNIARAQTDDGKVRADLTAETFSMGE